MAVSFDFPQPAKNPVATVVATIKLHGNSIYPPIWVAAGPMGVWVGNGYSGTVQRIKAEM